MKFETYGNSFWRDFSKMPYEKSVFEFGMVGYESSYLLIEDKADLEGAKKLLAAMAEFVERREKKIAMAALLKEQDPFLED